MDYDVIVAGGGSAGVAAAVGAAEAGRRTLLVERGPCLGGAATLRNVVTYCGLFTRTEPPAQAVFGVAERVMAKLRAADAVTPPTRFTAVAVVFDPETVKRALDEVCAEAGVDVLLHAAVTGARRDGDRVASVDVLDHRGAHTYPAAAFVDGSGEGDLAYHAGADVRYGTDGRVQTATLGIRFGGIPADADASRDSFQAAIKAAKARGVAPLAAERGLIARMPVSGDVIAYLADEEYDATDARSASVAEAHARAQARAYLEAVRGAPGCGAAYIVSTGPELGTRESRHVIGRHRVPERVVLDGDTYPDAVAVGAWPIEYHPGVGVPAEWRFIGGQGVYGIPLRALHSANTANLFAAGRLVDGDRGAGGSMRAMGTAMATGHAAGVAAAQVASGTPADPAAVRTELNRQDARLPW
jgi:glycine/D-amino acid oxidase-like deaminating enzyme